MRCAFSALSLPFPAIDASVCIESPPPILHLGTLFNSSNQFKEGAGISFPVNCSDVERVHAFPWQVWCSVLA
ncbi:hypothetical protein THAOC_08071 [Thalassiosira oceanica]|uniref:Uncharacterized protein n=1 Tax=Thalassiosira oceanica TaxID=159749 RepID=K0T012_THAOC|nr:hypothetical protein THAOC_08071 [Thalassiosira oceanica]|eukprot:EJK70559.1 hypothetical protein THAOC_08071 [Thalassiosira oceanica]